VDECKPLPMGSFRPGPPPPYDFRCVMLTMPRVRLYRRIDWRVERMVMEGLMDEAAGMLRDGIAPGTTPAAGAYTRPLFSST
jgi:tRNA dimethylallyltransferase